MNYDEVISSLQVLGAIPLNSEDSNFQRIVPAMFAYADGRIYRELDFLPTDITLVPLAMQANRRDLELPDDVLGVHYINVCTPAGPVTDNSRRHPLERVSEAALNMFWPNPSFKRGLPKKFTLIGKRVPPAQTPSPLPPMTQPRPPIWTPESFATMVRVMPTPDRAYMLEVNGSVQPLPLSDTNRETYVSLKYAELLIACCMVYITGYQRDYGAQSDDPQRAMSWEAQYTKLRDGIQLEVSMHRGEGPGFTSLPPTPLAQQPR